MEAAAGSSARLLAAGRWPVLVSGDVGGVSSALLVVAGAGTDFRAVSDGLVAWREAYDRVAADLQLPPLPDPADGG